jgi:hypothetical protein
MMGAHPGVRDAFGNEDDDEQLHFSTGDRSQSQPDELRRGIALCRFLLVVDRGGAVRDRTRASRYEVDRPAGGISERDGPQASPPAQGSCLGRIKGVERAVALIVRHRAGARGLGPSGRGRGSAGTSRWCQEQISQGSKPQVTMAEAAGFEPARGLSPQPA